MTVYEQDSFDLRLEWGRDGVHALGPHCAVLIIVDVLVFTTTVDIALGRGGRVLPLPWRDERAVEAARAAGATLTRGGLAGIEGQAGGMTTLVADRPGHGWTLRPSSLVTLPTGTFLAISSPNGATLCAAAAETGTTVLAGCLRNASAVAAAAVEIAGDAPIGIVPAGERWRDTPDKRLRPGIEEILGAGAIADAVIALRGGTASGVADGVGEGAGGGATYGMGDSVGDGAGDGLADGSGDGAGDGVIGVSAASARTGGGEAGDGEAGAGSGAGDGLADDAGDGAATGVREIGAALARTSDGVNGVGAASASTGGGGGASDSAGDGVIEVDEASARTGGGEAGDGEAGAGAEVAAGGRRWTPSAEAELAALTYRAVAGRIAEVVAESVSGRELIAAGVPGDVRLATQVDASSVVPVLTDGVLAAR